MKKAMVLSLLTIISPVLSHADQVATSASISMLQGQLNDLNQQISAAQQTLSSVSQNLQAMQKQSTVLKQQIAQYGNATANQFKWVDVTDNQIPAHAFVAAENQNQSLYVCQAVYSNPNGYQGNGSLMIPGVVTAQGCVITYGGQAYLQPVYAILTSNVSGYWINGDQVKNTPVAPPVYRWGPAINTVVGASAAAPTPSNQPQPLYNSLALVGGQDSGSNTYICRVDINGEYFVGKGANNTCFIAAGAYEANWPVYQVLLTRQP